ncbi:MAG TPA: hypothetical protein VHI32_12910 [Burkholderiales bacterium]|nr:hypothetical protein [Burkholderiales bacterium]
MRALCWLLAALLSMPVLGQEQPVEKKPVAKKSSAKKQPAAKPKAHAKPTPEQIRRFNELEKQKAQ